ncbi:MAG: hypothetical protein ACE37E_07975 [Hyphomicrobiales bacterium]
MKQLRGQKVARIELLSGNERLSAEEVFDLGEEPTHFRVPALPQRHRARGHENKACVARSAVGREDTQSKVNHPDLTHLSAEEVFDLGEKPTHLGMPALPAAPIGVRTRNQR